MKNKLIRLIIMFSKYALLGVVIQLFAYTFLQATDGNAQQNLSVYEVTIDLNLHEVSLKEVFEAIENKTDYNFLYDKKLLRNTSSVSINRKNASVGEILMEISKSLNLKFKQINEAINVNLNDKSEAQSTPVEVMQTMTITGQVTSGEDNSTLPGVNVIIKGTAQGTVTDLDGMYSLDVPVENAILVFSSVGYNFEEVTVGNRTVVDMVLVPDITALDEIVVVGYGTQKKVNLTGAVSTIDTEGMSDAPLTNAAMALQGKGSGVQVIQGSGEAGYDQPTIKIRGVGTLGKGRSNPLILIDGIVGNINDVDPMDIENISVLKDAASAAIYGNRAANGVILITTKGGKRNSDIKVSYSGYYGIQQLTHVPKLLSAYQHALMYNEALENDGTSLFFQPEDLDKLQDALYIDDLDFPNNLSGSDLAKFNSDDGYYQNTNWAEMYYAPSPIQKHHISFSSGSDKSSSMFSLGYLNQDGVKEGNWAKTYNARLSQKVFLLDDKLRLSANLYWVKKQSDRGADTGLGDWDQIPWGGYYFPNGQYSSETFYALKLGAIDQTESDYIQGIIGAEITLVKNLKYKIEYAVQQQRAKTKKFGPSMQTYEFWQDRIDNTPSRLEDGESSYTRQTLNNTLHYDINAGKHTVNFLAGNAMEIYDFSSFSAGRMNLINNFQPQLILGDAGTMTNSSSAMDLGYLSYFGRVHYNYDERYLLELNIRRDGSSRFKEGKKWGTFPSLSAAWRISEEKFMNGVDWMQNFKVRGSYGVLGNQNVRDFYAASDVLAPGANYPIGSALEPGVFLDKLADKDISWETTEQKNIGVDLTLFEMLNFSFDVYERTTSDILVTVPIPSTTGIETAPYKNAGEVSNKGWDLTAGMFKDYESGFSFSVDLNVSSYKNKITSLGDVDTYYFGADDTGSKYVWKEGYPVNSFYGFDYGGIVSADNLDDIPEQVVSVEPGDMWFKDVAGGDDKVTYDDDRIIYGTPNPDFIYGLNIIVNWKNFDLNILLEGVQGIDAITYDPLYMPAFKNIHGKLDYLWDRWTPDNMDTNIPKATENVQKMPISNYFMENASYLRGKDVTLGYNLPKALMSKIRVDNLRIYANLHNFFTITDYRGLDPERPDPEVSTSSHQHPPLKTVTFGLQLQF